MDSSNKTGWGLFILQVRNGLFLYTSVNFMSKYKLSNEEISHKCYCACTKECVPFLKVIKQCGLTKKQKNLDLEYFSIHHTTFTNIACVAVTNQSRLAT